MTDDSCCGHIHPPRIHRALEILYCVYQGSPHHHVLDEFSFWINLANGRTLEDERKERLNDEFSCFLSAVLIQTSILQPNTTVSVR